MKNTTTSTHFEQPTTGELLRSAFVRKVKSNPKFSLRALARKAGVSPAFVSQVFNNRKVISAARATQLGQILDLSDADMNYLKTCLQNNNSSQIKFEQRKKSLKKYQDIAADQFALISDWYHAAIMDLSTTLNFKSDPTWIAKRLNLTIHQTKDAVTRLQRMGLMTTDIPWQKTKKNIEIKSKTSLGSIRQYHRQSLENAIRQLERYDQLSFERRLISGLSVAANPTKVPEAKRLLNQCLDQIAQLLNQGECSEVYQISVQMFALTQSLETKGTNNE